MGTTKKAAAHKQYNLTDGTKPDPLSITSTPIVSYIQDSLHQCPSISIQPYTTPSMPTVVEVIVIAIWAARLIFGIFFNGCMLVFLEDDIIMSTYLLCILVF
jgi:hypothetical protein